LIDGVCTTGNPRKDSSHAEPHRPSGPARKAQQQATAAAAARWVGYDQVLRPRFNGNTWRSPDLTGGRHRGARLSSIEPEPDLSTREAKGRAALGKALKTRPRAI